MRIIKKSNDDYVKVKKINGSRYAMSEKLKTIENKGSFVSTQSKKLF